MIYYISDNHLIWSETRSETCNIKLRCQICQGLNLRPFKSSIWLSDRILRVKTHTLAINWSSRKTWVCISVCPWSYLIFKTDCSGVNIRQNWFIFTARLQTKNLSRNLSRKSTFNSEQYMWLWSSKLISILLKSSFHSIVDCSRSSIHSIDCINKLFS